MPNWKTPGTDQIPNFWLKKLSASHSFLANALNEIMENSNKGPEWSTEGNTYLVAKEQNTQDPKNFRPITCLPTIYKTLTSILAKKTYSYLENFQLLPEKQKGCRVGSFESKDQLLINRMITEITKNKKSALSQAWIKLLTVYHTWILEVIKMYEIQPQIFEFIMHTMPRWKINLGLRHMKENMEIPGIKIKTRILQRDSLSLLLFYLSLCPLSILLNGINFSSIHVGKAKKEIRFNHLFYMDDLKRYSKSDSDLRSFLRIVKKFSDDIKMQFGLENV